jgi:tetratricopeptide (TPR) repeat protein
LILKVRISRLNQEISLNPAESGNYFRLAELYQENRRYTEAREILFALLRQEPGKAERKEVFLWLAEFYREQGDFQEALNYWHKAFAATERPGNDASLHELHGRILIDHYVTMGLADQDRAILDQAVESLQHAITLEPDRQLLASIYLDLGWAYRNLDMPDAAIDYLKKALAQQPKDKQRLAECYEELGLVELWSHENDEKAIPWLQLALKASPLRPPSNWLAFVYCRLGWAFLMSGHARKAAKVGQKALRAADSRQHDYDAALSGVHSLLGAAYSDIPGQEDLAIHHYLEALDLEEDQGTYHRLGDLYLKKNELGQALRMYEESLRLGPGSSGFGNLYNAMGVCLAKMKRYDEALTYFEKAREEQATVSFKPYELYSNIGISYWHLDRYDEAAEAFKAALSLMHPKDKGYQKMEWYLRQVQSRTGLVDDTSP